jgi:hypothetical protein
LQELLRRQVDEGDSELGRGKRNYILYPDAAKRRQLLSETKWKTEVTLTDQSK